MLHSTISAQKGGKKFLKGFFGRSVFPPQCVGGKTATLLYTFHTNRVKQNGKPKLLLFWHCWSSYSLEEKRASRPEENFLSTIVRSPNFTHWRAHLFDGRENWTFEITKKETTPQASESTERSLKGRFEGWNTKLFKLNLSKTFFFQRNKSTNTKHFGHIRHCKFCRVENNLKSPLYSHWK